VYASYDLSSSNFLLSSTRHSGASVRPWDREIDQVRNAFVVRSCCPQDIQVWENVAASDLIDIGNICVDDIQIILIVDDVLEIGKDATENLHEVLNGVGGIRGKPRDHGENREFVGFVLGKAEGEGGEISVGGTCGGRSVQEGIDHCNIAVPAVDCGDYLVLRRTHLTLGISHG
jgi:hypothetical protein